MSQTLRFADLAAVLVDSHGDERLDAVVVVDPAPDLALMFVAGGPVIEVGVAAEQSRPRLELVGLNWSYLPRLHAGKLPRAVGLPGRYNLPFIRRREESSWPSETATHLAHHLGQTFPPMIKQARSRSTASSSAGHSTTFPSVTACSIRWPRSRATTSLPSVHSSRNRLAAGVPPHWQMYVTVADVDAAAALVEGAGGKVHVQPFDVMDAGRMAVIQDPTGAFLMLWSPTNNIGAGRVNEPGAFTWSELVAPPNDRTASFYETVLGLKIDLRTDGRWVHIQRFHPRRHASDDARRRDLTATAHVSSTSALEHLLRRRKRGRNRCEGLGTRREGVRRAIRHPSGRMAVAVDPQGAMFSLFEMARATD